MAEFLYACQFSSGHIKVGRSADPENRISSHADRLRCAGILLTQRFIVECVGSSIHAEAALIERCAHAASARHLEEWFEGLDFNDVCAWAVDAVSRKFSLPHTDSRWRLMLAEMKECGLTQTDIATRCNCDQTTISALSSGRASEPRHSLGERLIAIHASIRTSIPA